MSEGRYAFAATEIGVPRKIVEERAGGLIDEWTLDVETGQFVVKTRDGHGVELARRDRSIAATLVCLHGELRAEAERLIADARAQLLLRIKMALEHADHALAMRDVHRITLANAEAYEAVVQFGRLTLLEASADGEQLEPPSRGASLRDGFVTDFRGRFGRDPLPAEYPRPLAAVA